MAYTVRGMTGVPAEIELEANALCLQKKGMGKSGRAETAAGARGLNAAVEDMGVALIVLRLVDGFLTFSLHLGIASSHVPIFWLGEE